MSSLKVSPQVSRLAMLFNPGRMVATPGALDALSNAQVDPRQLIQRHLSGDWGDLDEHDKKENDFSLNKRLRIFSAYILPSTKVKVWVITEADRSATTILLPDEY